MSLKDKQKSKKRLFKNFCYDFVKLTGAVPAMILYRIKYHYETPSAARKIKGGAIVISNHLGPLDPIRVHCILWYRRLNFVAMKELFDTKVKGWFFSKMHCIPVDRENFNMSTFSKVMDVSKEGGITCIFPEGHITLGDEAINTFKSGMILMALRAGVPIIPIYMAPQKSIWSRQNVVIGEPIDIKALCGKIPDIKAIENAAETLRKKEIELMELYIKENGND
ncbi:MAG: 1-acyl-sn-glycerol-3-phosphate acyltransferase [Ruminococcaceae bacterium]|nr:1-acyl-sn-glycerol-3-phosphate acyltransferase [Oscillospiraceae bacterium]